MKPVRDKKKIMSNPLRRKKSKGEKCVSDPNLVEVCDLKEKTDKVKRSMPEKSGFIREVHTPLGAPSAKRRRQEGRSTQGISALVLTPAAATKQDTQVTVINTSFQEDYSTLSGSSSSILDTLPVTIPHIDSSRAPTTSEDSFDSTSSKNELLSSSWSSISNDEGGGDFSDGLTTPPVESFQGANSNLGEDYRLVSLETGSSYLLLLQRDTRIPVRGLAQISCLYGAVIIHGYKIKQQTPNQSIATVFCPVNVSAKCLEIGHSERRELEQKEKNALLQSISALQPCSMTAQEVLSEMSDMSTLVLVSKLNHQPSSFITSHMTYKNLYSGGSAKKMLQKSEIAVCDKVGLFINPGTVHYQNVIQLHPDYDSAAQILLEAIQSDSSNSPRVMFVGPKNSGKSTALRYLANRLLSVSQNVGYLECDPGQCEFTTPAILSLHIIKEALLGPPFTHVQSAEKAYFLGDVNVDDHAENYVKMITALYRQYSDQLSHLPLFINTMGWVEGLGLRLLGEVARITQPTHIICLGSPDERLVALFNQNEGKNLSYFSVPSVTGQPLLPPKQFLRIEAKCQTDSYQASSQRELNLLAAFSKLLPPNLEGKRLTDIRPHVVPWSHVVLHICHMTVPANQILYAANASVVALCTTSKEELDRCHVEKGSEGLRTLKSTPISECLGIGIIRGIDPQKKAFYILPALEPNLLPKVNTLLVGSPFIPECVFDQQFSTKGAPYLSESFDTNVPGSLPINPKTYLRRGPGGKPQKT
ncbi:polynucleotide 5'-hydroxyl-kinase NOL9-like [Lytechinus pictus]|uniref:polynucleotide 5'-hydroxyl-kinase NOL9-like n=1 Tax=Lytechinus pictus TaxID=7653 RepID=UPI0030BA147C